MRLLPLLLVGCALGDPATDTPVDSDGADLTGPVEVTDASFPCLTAMSPIRRFYVDNLLGDLDATLAVADDPRGKAWPVGSLVQLVPIEAMVKREAGFSPSSGDWEFFSLDVSADGATIRERGVEDVANQFGGNCFSCHSAASAEWDFVCEQDHGCVKLPLDEAAVRDLQALDPRCGG